MSILNRIKILTDFISRKDLVSGFPVEIGIEMTNRCNLKCKMCARETMTRPVGDMPLGLLKKIVDEVKPYAEMVYLHGDGEPLLHKQIFEAIEYVKKSNLKVGLSSNATLLDEPIAHRLIDSKLDYLILALDGATKETYEKIRVNGRFEQVVENVERFLALKRAKRSNMYVLIQFIVMEENKKEIKAFADYWKKFKPDIIRFKPYVDLFGTKSSTQFSLPCFYLWRQTMIDWDGTVFPCCVDTNSSHRLGNVSEASLMSIWNGPALRDLRKKHILGKQNQIDICRNCDMYQFSYESLVAVSLINGYQVKKYLPYWENLTRT
ncbi:MAG: SPASM domain-containing protein [Candidatus Omnitrophica bacterium]|nr:SPASM domain-containing protein [Candidatus Omnitrophota bacterium]